MIKQSICSLLLLLALSSCKKEMKRVKVDKSKINYDFTISFGSCNNQHIKNNLWKPILENEPNVFIWGGDIIYSDTDDMNVMRSNYNILKNDRNYQQFISKVPVLGTWDDHDYGVNDGGENYSKKDSVQQLFLDFFNVKKSDPRRSRKGIYHSENFNINGSNIKIILLDTRFFRTELTKDPTGKKRYIPEYKEGNTMLGEDQWKWLKQQLHDSDADYHIIMSSVQFLSYEHGFESWGTMPHEVERMQNLMETTNAKRVIFLSGDRHLAEISKAEIAELNYPLIDFTSSGMTHSYISFSGEKNKYRLSDVVSDKNFGILKFNLKDHLVTMEIRGEENILYESHIQKY